MRANYKCFLTAIILLPILILNLGCQQQKNDNKIEALIDAKDNTSTEKTVSKNIYPDTTGESL